jgi:diguanylate cyclase (GGDEF)-like protein
MRSLPRLLTIYAAMALVPVLGLGIALAITFRDIANQRGLTEGREAALIIAETAVEPQLNGRPLSQGLDARERAALERLVGRTGGEHSVLRLRLRDLSGKVIFSDDGSGLAARGADRDALTAARKHVVARLTHLNADGNDSGPTGVAVVEVYMPLFVGRPDHPVGVLELYLPYAPIAADVNSEIHSLYLPLGLGLAALYLALFFISLSMSRGLRREVAFNAFLAHHDTLTELPNRALFMERAQLAMERSARSQRPGAIAVVDLDHFKDINDALGYLSGDQLLTELARRVDASMRPGDTVARLGGDEFGIILCDVDDPLQALTRLRGVMGSDVEIRGLPLSVEPSIGFAIIEFGAGDVETLVQQADIAMYAAKAQHTGVVEYSEALARYGADDLALISELRHAIKEDQLVLHYQPQTGLRSGSIHAVEALVRWQHPSRGLLGPDKFLPLAEQTDLIEHVTEWVLAQALRDVAKLTDAGHDIEVAVNVSARSVVRSSFARQVIDTVESSGVAASKLIVEVTETALLTDPERAGMILSELARSGIHVSIDDFGRGHTSISYLSELPISELKIDRSFVTDMCGNRAHVAIVRSIVELAHNLSMRVVAEGIEDEAVLRMLRELQCDLAQGYHIGRPMPAADLAQFLSATLSRDR